MKPLHRASRPWTWVHQGQLCGRLSEVAIPGSNGLNQPCPKPIMQIAALALASVVAAPLEVPLEVLTGCIQIY
eukprot:2608302-Amphidinium_carterae.1